MPLKYFYDTPEAVKVTGMAHGVLFIAYCILLALCMRKFKWPLRFGAYLFVATLIPFGTFVPELEQADPPKYGLVKNLGTFAVLRVAYHEWIAMLTDAARPGLPLRARLGYLLGPPGWSHDGSRQTSSQLKAEYLMRNPEQAGRPGLARV